MPVRRPTPRTAARLVSMCLLSLLPVAASAAVAVLHWTAPGDDGVTGVAARYDVRRSAQPITAASFALADTVGGIPQPVAAGGVQSCAVTVPDDGTRVWFAMRTVDEAGNWSAVSNVASFAAPVLGVAGRAPDAFALGEPWPNPARASAQLILLLPEPTAAEAVVYDAGGRRVRTLWAGALGAGRRTLAWDLRDDGGRPAAAGVYFVRVRAGARREVRRVVVAR